ncbi:MAG: bifunctional precorrin-2 dehydrogenase/sirohydrochlorin ferrochelatase [Actinobacteria bacterium]|nr:bifunctional precorrin-2 dehydrogenase/sirohydrochlorin ferrochelatase [Actinomycetota bacterium]
MSDNELFFACIDLAGRPVLVVGGGPVAFEKIETLLAARASIRVVAPEVCDEVSALVDSGSVAWDRKAYEASDLEDAFLAVAATGDTEVSRAVHDDAEARSMLVNVADVQHLCNFILPAVHRSGPLAVAVSTGGASPALAQRLRSEIGALVDDSYARLAGLLAELRPWAKEHLSTYADRKAFFDDIVKGPVDPVSLLKAGDEAAVAELIAAAQARAL